MAFHERDADRALRSGDLLALGMEADQLRYALHPEGVVTYTLVAPAGLSLEDAADQARSYGSKTVSLAEVAEIRSLPLSELKTRLPALQSRLQERRGDAAPLEFHALPVTELLLDGQPGTWDELHGSGLRSLLLNASELIPTSELPGTEMLLQTAARLSLGVTVSYSLISGEPADDRIGALRSIRALQQSTGAIQSVVVRIHHAASPEARREEETTAVDYLKTLAVARLLLDNIEHVGTEWGVMGPKVLELALRFGADDAGAVPWSQQGSREPSHHGGEAELRRIIRDAGLRPVERDALFRQSMLR